MKTMGKIIIIFGSFVFILSQPAYSQGLSGLKSSLSTAINNKINAGKKLSSTTLNTIGNNTHFKSIKTKTGNFVGKHTRSVIGETVKTSSWRNVASVSGFRKAAGIAIGTANGALSKNTDKGFVTAMELGNLGSKKVIKSSNPGERFRRYTNHLPGTETGSQTHYFTTNIGTIKPGVPYDISEKLK